MITALTIGIIAVALTLFLAIRHIDKVIDDIHIELNDLQTHVKELQAQVKEIKIRSDEHTIQIGGLQ